MVVESKSSKVARTEISNHVVMVCVVVSSCVVFGEARSFHTLLSLVWHCGNVLS